MCGLVAISLQKVKIIIQVVTMWVYAVNNSELGQRRRVARVEVALTSLLDKDSISIV
jgi:hypothetical protein